MHFLAFLLDAAVYDGGGGVDGNGDHESNELNVLEGLWRCNSPSRQYGCSFPKVYISHHHLHPDDNTKMISIIVMIIIVIIHYHFTNCSESRIDFNYYFFDAVATSGRSMD